MKKAVKIGLVISFSALTASFYLVAISTKDSTIETLRRESISERVVIMESSNYSSVPMIIDMIHVPGISVKDAERKLLPKMLISGYQKAWSGEGGRYLLYANNGRTESDGQLEIIGLPSVGKGVIVITFQKASALQKLYGKIISFGKLPSRDEVERDPLKFLGESK